MKKEFTQCTFQEVFDAGLQDYCPKHCTDIVGVTVGDCQYHCC